MKKGKMILTTFLLTLLLTAVLTGCGAGGGNLMLYLKFDEGSGVMVKDSSGNLPETEMTYGFAHAAYMENQDPQWRKEGVKGGCLLFDGSNTYINYNRKDITVEGGALTVSVWIAPRTFEWDDPYAADNGTDAATGIISQSDKAANKGFLLGYERFGRLTFQAGTGDDWLTVWTNGDNLSKYEWNYVAATFDSKAGDMCLYLNGELVASRSVPEGAEIAGAGNKALAVGRNMEAERLTAGFLNVASGYMDELKIYGEALTAEEIKKEYESVKVPEIEFSEIWLQNILTGDYTRPQFHGGPYQFWMNEPHAPVYYNGMYHLFYQANMTGSYWRNICWGHLVSTDMVNWKPVKEAITPTENSVVPDGVWSGGAALDANGVPLLFFTAGNDGFRDYEGLISNQNIGVAYPADLTDPELTEWTICDELALIQQKGEGRTGEFRDPHIWKEGDTWCMLVCSGSTSSNGGAALLYTTDTLELKDDGTVDMDWQYKGSVYEMENQSALYGTSWELPIILPVTNEAGTERKYFFSISPAPASIADNKVYYWLGDFDLATGKFTPDEAFQGEPHLLDYGANVFTGPSCIVDPVSGNIYMFSIMQDQRGAAEQGASGWAHTVGLARRIWLNDEGTDLMIAPIEELHSLEEEALIQESNLTLEAANELLAKVDEDMLYIRLTADVSAASQFAVSLKQGGKWDATTYTYDVAGETIQGRTENKGEGASVSTVNGALPNRDGRITMEIYVDRSLVEAFFNNYKAISIRAYTDEPDSHGISLSAEGSVTIEELYVAPMGSIF
ncbi:MAG: GH32 C-terminal domain-containing protein [Roseburia sp.]|nr:GH32 C-terminal domain-containing protein [Roseburia sp.]MCM1098018.1 GH32 C-terminal domain-containing protein [Ruminococcus flavefaciens]